MMRQFYILLLRLHPRAFGQRFGDEMLGIFDQSDGKSSLMADGVISLFRQWTIRPHSATFSATTTADGVPMFYSAEPEIPGASALMRGAVISFFLFGTICFVMTHRWRQASMIVGSHHPSPSHLLAAPATAQPVDLPSEVTVKPYVSHPPIAPYFRFLLVLAALDQDQDNVISAAEMDDAPAVLRMLDTNRDGVLSAEECGLKIDRTLDPLALGRARLNFMRIHPVLAALDTNHDGEISESEMRNAASALRSLDANHDGKLVLSELLPDGATAIAAGIMEMLDKNGDGRISRNERTGPQAERLRELLDRAERNGFVTEQDLVKAMGQPKKGVR